MADFLPASAYKPGDNVIGTDEGGSYFGCVSDRQDASRAERGEVLVYWSGEDYSSGSLGHVVESDMLPNLRLWPAAANADRLATIKQEG